MEPKQNITPLEYYYVVLCDSNLARSIRAKLELSKFKIDNPDLLLEMENLRKTGLPGLWFDQWKKKNSTSAFIKVIEEYLHSRDKGASVDSFKSRISQAIDNFSRRADRER